MENVKKSLIETLLIYGAMNAKINKKQEMKLREWIIPSLLQEYNDGKIGMGHSEIMNIKNLRKFIDRWEGIGKGFNKDFNKEDLNEKDYKYYYVDKNSDGSSLWDLIS
jgi:hypothetical protein